MYVIYFTICDLRPCGGANVYMPVVHSLFLTLFVLAYEDVNIVVIRFAGEEVSINVGRSVFKIKTCSGVGNVWVGEYNGVTCLHKSTLFQLGRQPHSSKAQFYSLLSRFMPSFCHSRVTFESATRSRSFVASCIPSRVRYHTGVTRPSSYLYYPHYDPNDATPTRAAKQPRTPVSCRVLNPPLFTFLPGFTSVTVSRATLEKQGRMSSEGGILSIILSICSSIVGSATWSLPLFFLRCGCDIIRCVRVQSLG